MKITYNEIEEACRKYEDINSWNKASLKHNRDVFLTACRWVVDHINKEYSGYGDIEFVDEIGNTPLPLPTKKPRKSKKTPVGIDSTILWSIDVKDKMPKEIRKIYKKHISHIVKGPFTVTYPTSDILHLGDWQKVILWLFDNKWVTEGSIITCYKDRIDVFSQKDK